MEATGTKIILLSGSASVKSRCRRICSFPVRKNPPTVQRSSSPPAVFKSTGVRLSRTSFLGCTLESGVANGVRCTAIWLDNVAEVECNISPAEAYDLWDDTELIPSWMKWVNSVKVIESKPRKVSEWTLSTHQFGRDWQFSWEATNLTPLKNQKIHWRAEKGVPNRGAIRFFPRKDKTKCAVQLTISYEVPEALVPFGNALTPLVEGILNEDMKRFSKFAEEQYAAKE